MYALGAEFEPVKPGLELLPGRKLFNQMFLLLLLIMQCVLLTPGETGAGYQSAASCKPTGVFFPAFFPNAGLLPASQQSQQGVELLQESQL